MVYKDYELSTSSNRVLENRSKHNPFNVRLINSIGGFPVLISCYAFFGTSFYLISKHLKDLPFRSPFNKIARFGSALLISHQLSRQMFEFLVVGTGDANEFNYLTNNPNEKLNNILKVEGSDFITKRSYEDHAASKHKNFIQGLTQHAHN